MLRLRRSRIGILRALGVTEVNLVAVARKLVGPDRLGRLVQEREHTLRKIRHAELIPRGHLATLEDFDWSRTKACYVFGDAIRVNMRGREPRGIVEPGAEFERLLDNITSSLLAVKDPSTGANLIKAVHRPRDLYEGKYSGEAGDLILEMSDGYAADEYVGGDLIVPSAHRYGPRILGPSGTHAPEGLVAALGPDIRSGSSIEARIVDIAPTILYLMGLPIPSQMDGKVLLEALEPAFTERTSPKRTDIESDEAAQNVYTPEELKIVEDRLRALGYLP